MSHYPHPILAREGWLFTAIAVVVAIVVTLTAAWPWALLCWVITLFVIQFFRDPARVIASE
jgi:phosphatidylserine decarboxylase